MFRELSADARGILEVVAFFPQSINEDHINWLFPAISDRSDVFDTSSILSLIYRSHGHITMLAPFCNYLRSKDPTSSLLLATTKERYFTPLSLTFFPRGLILDEGRWIMPEDANVEHLLDVFTSIDVNSDVVWEACY